jgi:methyltransferase (TIGR00027 family)
MLAIGLKVLFDPKDEVGMGYEGHTWYTGARTKLINDKLDEWLDSTEGPKQVLNMGAGMDTRAFWHEGLKKSNTYYEVDSKPVNDSKNKILDDLHAKGERGEPFCERKVISLDFNIESAKDIPNHGFNNEVPTCFIYEGLIMYLEPEANLSLMRETSQLAAKGSYLMLNTIESAMNPKGALAPLEPTLLNNGWEKVESRFFGDEKFNYGRYPEGKTASTIFSFQFFKKTVDPPKYRLSYFPLYARGEPIRMMLEHANVTYDDKTITFDDWPDQKKNYPNG